MYKIIYFFFALIIVPQLCQGQTGCHASFRIQQSGTNLTINFIDSSISSTPITSWLWDFGDGHGSTSNNPHHTYAHAGTYQVCLTIHNNHGCGSTYCHPVTVSPVQTGCHASFRIQQSGTNLTINFIDSSISSTPITSWLWDFGDGHGSTSSNPHHTYAHAGTYQVCLTVHNNHGCSSTYCHPVTVSPVQTGCHASFRIQQSGTNLTVNFIDSSISSTPITSWLWDFGDGHGSTIRNPHHTYAHAGTYQVCLTVHNNHGCSSTYCHPVTVSPVQTGCHASFRIQQSGTNLTVNFIDSSSSSTPITSWLWDFGDGHGSTIRNPHHTYAHAGTYKVCLTVHNNHGCSSTYCHPVVVHKSAHECIASYTSHFEQKMNRIRFLNTSANTSAHIQYLWDFGDGHSSTLENPNHTYAHPGIYTVCLFITDEVTGCNSHICNDVMFNQLWHAMDVGQDNLVTSRAFLKQAPETNTDINFVNFPNPFITSTTIKYELKSASSINIEMYDLSGRLVNPIFNGIQPKGEYSFILSGEYLIENIYILKLAVNDEIFYKKLLVAK